MLRGGDKNLTGRRWLVELRYVFHAIHILRVPVIIACVSASLIALPEQVLEIYRSIVQEVSGQTENSWSTWRETALSGASVILICVAIWWSGRRLAALFGHQIPDHARGGRWLLNWLPPVIAVLPLAAGALAISFGATVEKASKDVVATFAQSLRDTGTKPPFDRLLAQDYLSFNEDLYRAGILLGLLAAALIVIFGSGSILYRRWTQSAPSEFLSRPSRLLVYGLVSGGILAFAFAPPIAAQSIGVFSIFAFFIVGLLLILSQISVWSDRTGVPVLFLLLLAAAIFTLLDLNDNHWLRTVDGSEAPTRIVKPISSEIVNDWLESRSDWKAYKANNKPYPIYIVAAQGGGIYAAYHAASFLSGIQDIKPEFAQHIFAISGVSGGSVGAAFFASLIKTVATQPNYSDVLKDCVKRSRKGRFTFVDASSNYFRADLLSPLFASLFFPDFLQRFLFFPVGYFDRARAIEGAIENAWVRRLKSYRRHCPQLWRSDRKPLGQPFSALWTGRDATPALLLNATEVGSGRRRVISPFSFAGSNDIQFQSPYPWIKSGDETSAIPLSSAAMVSARFPWLTPSGWSRNKDGKKIRLVDGGYFENSGLATAADLANALLKVVKGTPLEGRFDIKLIALTSADYPVRKFYGFNELAGPIRGLLNTRTARSAVTVSQVKKSHNLRTVTLDMMGYPLPLGWRLSPVTRGLISAQAGRPRACNNAKYKGRRFSSDCVVDEILKDLIP